MSNDPFGTVLRHYKMINSFYYAGSFTPRLFCSAQSHQKKIVKPIEVLIENIRELGDEGHMYPKRMEGANEISELNNTYVCVGFP